MMGPGVGPAEGWLEVLSTHQAYTPHESDLVFQVVPRPASRSYRLKMGIRSQVGLNLSSLISYTGSSMPWSFFTWNLYTYFFLLREILGVCLIKPV